MPRTKGLDDPERKVIADVEQYGWHCLHVLGGEDTPQFSYTIGLQYTWSHPELIVVGLPPDVAHGILGLMVDALKTGTPIALDRPTDALLEDLPCVFVPVPKERYAEWVGFARWYYEGNDFELVQIVWPNREGHFPWHSQASKPFRAVQPILGATA